ncbi:hypothetical protein ACFL6I_13750 [candidate division KSB1 bacterium]
MPKKRSAHKKRKRELKAPHPMKVPFRWKRLVFWMTLIILAIIISGIAFVSVQKMNKRKALEKKLLGYEQEINGTPIQATKEVIEEIVASGTAPVAKQKVLSGTDDYICTVTTDKGIITLKKRGDLMKEEVIREKANTTILFIEDKMYFYHPGYKVWGMFSYDENAKISNKVMTSMAFSLGELQAINQTEYLCLETTLPEDEFSLGDIDIVDVEELNEDLRFLR